MHIFRVTFYNNGKLYQLHAQRVDTTAMYGFVEISELLFGEHTSVVIDPAEERLKAEFNEVERLLLPMHSIVRIEQVKRHGQNKILDIEGTAVSNITPFPMPPGDRGNK